MKTERFHGTIMAQTPIHHGGPENYGTVKTILTLPYLTEDGNIVNVPAVHGNAIRGYLRRLIMQDLFDNIGYGLDNPKVYHALFTGGILEAKEKSSGRVDAPLRREIRTTLPPVALFGTAIGNQMIQGKLKVDIAYPIILEVHGDDGAPGAYTIRGRDFGTRLDDLRDYDRGEDEQATQMKYEFEIIIPGTRFQHEFTLHDATPIERACFIRALNLWAERPYLGGKSSTGYGKVAFAYDGWECDAEREYMEYLTEEKDSVIGVLGDLERIL